MELRAKALFKFIGKTFDVGNSTVRTIQQVFGPSTYFPKGRVLTKTISASGKAKQEAFAIDSQFINGVLNGEYLEY